MAVIAGRNVGTNDLVVIGAGVLMFVDSFFPLYGIGPYHDNSWNGGFTAILPLLLVLAVAGLAAARVFRSVALPPVAGGAVSWTFVSAAASALAVLFILLRWVTIPQYTSAKVGLYIALVIAIVQTVFGYLSIVAAGERLPWQKSTTA
jgi:hypothetical protein